MKSNEIPSQIRYEDVIEQIVGDGWRRLSETDIDGALGIAIVHSILDGISPDIYQMSCHLNVSKQILSAAFLRLSLNGAFLRNKIQDDRPSLRRRDKLAWGYYAGYASGATGNVSRRPKHKPAPRS